MGAIMEQLLTGGQGGDYYHPIKYILPVQVVLTPMLFYPGSVIWINHQFRGGDDRVSGKHLGFDICRVVSSLPSSLQVFDSPQIEHGAENRPFCARTILGGHVGGSSLRDASLCPGCVARREVPVKPPSHFGYAGLLEGRVPDVSCGADGRVNEEK